MKPLVAVLAGFIATTMIFVSGGAVAMFLFITTPSEHFDPNNKTAALWSPTPTDANGEPRSLRVIPAKVASDTSPKPVVQVADASAAQGQRIDMAATASIADTGANKVNQENSALSQAHVAWCEQNYRSYRRETNSFTPYGGGSKPCISPYSNERMGGSSNSEDNAQYASNDVAELSDAHINDCMNRYRSYRVSDNTFQPYGGGPRQQCR